MKKMRRKVLMLSLLAITCIASAQDMIVTKSGDVITAYELEIGPSSIYYKAGSADGSVQKISKGDVLAINKKDGTKIKLEGDAGGTTASSASATSDSGKWKEANDALIKQYNDQTFYVRDGKSGKKGKLAYCKLNISSTSMLENEDVMMQFGTVGDGAESAFFSGTDLRVMVKNKTSKTLFIDLANTFFSRGDEAQPYYVPTATATSNGRTSGGAVNMGAVAGAIGVGGALGRLAGGVTLGGSNTQTTTTVEYSQRIVSVPPMSSLSLPVMPFFVAEMRSIPMLQTRTYGDGSVRGRCGIEGLMAGDVVHWNEQNSPIRFSVFLSYAKDEALSDLRNIRAELYANDLLGVARSADNGTALLKFYDNLFGPQAPLHFVMRNDPGEMVPTDINTLNYERLLKK